MEGLVYDVFLWREQGHPTRDEEQAARSQEARIRQN